ncbi:metallophosphoesterase family protein [Luteolibacter luteus]|uniref:Calcineurin-like phosphoesterase domain-containing protein n=1 Tax=Luteolibacter luteus TaxID=2728835 RepID=A0A858RG34_9BACT|nr:metallophosphoesterase [Luteolibacter luteus]QJE95508.1 hypothetical protein HHL09_06830 [Luteolibacter luteus]
MLRAIAIADDDGLVGNLESDPVDLLISLGDLWDASIDKAVASYKPRRTFAVRGNHDTDAPFARHITSLHYTVEHFSGLSFGGFNGSWRYKPRGHHLFEQHEVSRMLRSFPRVDVFVAHNSPRGIHERDGEVHQGFDGFLDYLEKQKPRYFLHGHQHLNQISQIGETQVIGVFGEALIQLA